MKNNIMIQLGVLIFIVIILLPVVSAFKINTDVELNQVCNNCSYCNVSKINYPNSSVFLKNLPMTKDLSSYNYTINSSYIVTQGTYDWYYHCGNEIESETGKLSFEVTDTGYDVTELSKSAIYFILVMACLFFIGFLYFQVPPVKWSFLLLFVLFLVIGINIVSISIHNQIGNTSLGAIFDQLSAISYIIYWFIFGLLLTIWILTTIASMADKKNMNKLREIGSVR